MHGEVLVVRAKAPTTPTGPGPHPWPGTGTDLRYWSLCIDLYPQPKPVVVNHLAGEKVDFGCRYDSEVALDRTGYYTFVVGTEAERPTIDHVPGATFLPFSLAYPGQSYMLNLRNMLPAPGFNEAVQDVPEDANPSSAARVMGPYYPREAFCPLAVLVKSGPGACPGGK